ncbi:hypothetical protein BGZ68_006921 [Mortierella alpina]|nr:hypothetical protein BGZ68_006921 [Mortierella alpina]
MLASGSLYVFALYAPSFTGHLGYSQTQTSTIAVIGDIGLYGVGPVSGLMADRLGPKHTSFFAGCLLFLGYRLLSEGYAVGLENVAKNEPPIHFLLMAMFLLLAGMGSSASYMAAFTSLAKNFRTGRGIALGIPVSFFGLSAAALTLVSQKYFMKKVDDTLLKPSLDDQELDTVRFLHFLGVAGGFINMLAIVGMNIVPAPPQKAVPAPYEGHVVSAPAAPTDSSLNSVPHEQSSLLSNDSLVQRTSPPQNQASYESTAAAAAPTESPQRPQRLRRRSVRSVSGKAFFLNRDAQYFFVVMLCLAGTGLMIINSITAMVDTVAASEIDDSPLAGFVSKLTGEKSPVASIRANHVALISLTSYAGRILSAFGSDFAIARYGAHRIDTLPIASAIMALAQAAGMVMPLHWLYTCSALTGLAYGGFFAVAGIIVAELWGEDTCGQNWGWLSWGSALGGMLFNLLFGVVMDSARPIIDGETQACKGHGCFRPALYVSFWACACCCGLSVLMGRRQRRAETPSS